MSTLEQGNRLPHKWDCKYECVIKKNTHIISDLSFHFNKLIINNKLTQNKPGSFQIVLQLPRRDAILLHIFNAGIENFAPSLTQAFIKLYGKGKYRYEYYKTINKRRISFNNEQQRGHQVDYRHI